MLHGAEAESFCEKLEQLLVNEEQWETVYWDRAGRDLWVKSHKRSEAHGGGPADLQLTAPDLIAHRVSGQMAWRCSNFNTATSFLIELWCERRALKALRLVLAAWPHNGLTDGLELLREAFSMVRAFGGTLEPIEAELLGLALNQIDRTLNER